MTGLDIIQEALLLIGAARPGGNPSAQIIADCGFALNNLLDRWNQEGPAYFEPIADLRDAALFPAGHLQAVVYNLAIALEPLFMTIVNQHVHAMAREAWTALVRAEDSGVIDCEPARRFNRGKAYRLNDWDRALLLILQMMLTEVERELEEFRMAA